jgi:hypothetical protein
MPCQERSWHGEEHQYQRYQAYDFRLFFAVSTFFREKSIFMSGESSETVSGGVAARQGENGRRAAKGVPSHGPFSS